MNSLIVGYYEKEEGKHPVEEFLLSIDKKMRAEALGKKLKATFESKV